MSARAKLYIGSVIAIGVTLLSGCLLFQREFRDPAQYLAYLLLACIGSTLKIKLPKVRGTMSVNFLFILIGVAQLTLAETVTIGGIATLVQCLLRARKPPTLVQVLFNLSALVTSIYISYYVSHWLATSQNLPVLLAVAVGTLFLSNTGMVSLVVSLTEDKPILDVWQQIYLWSFPYYLIGGVLTGAIAVSSRTAGWAPSLFILPLMYLVYLYYRLYLLQQTEIENPQPS